MIKISIKLAFKNIVKEIRQSVISATGLAIALSCSILILIYIRYELSYDNFHVNKDNIYRIITKNSVSHSYMGKDVFTVTPAPLKYVLTEDIPGVKNSSKCRFFTHTLEYKSSLFTERGFLYADPDFLKIFTFPSGTGNPSEALNEPFSLFLTRKMALKYFGNEEPVGKTLLADNKYLFTVRGVLENIPENSHLTFDFLTGFETFYSIRGGREKVENWTNLSYVTYIQLFDNADKDVIKVQLKELPARYLPKEPVFADLQWIMVPLKDIHLGGNANFDPGKNNDVRYLYLIISIGIFILLIACFDFMNIVTARAYNRGRETAVFKVTGCSKTRLMIQLITESVLLSFFGLILALIIVGFLLPFFSAFTERALTYSMILEFPTMINVIMLTIILGIASSIYPAFHLSSMNPMSLIREEFKNSGLRKRSATIRNLFVVIQYVISIIALVCTFTLLKQLNFFKNSDVGFVRENILTISIKDPAIRSRPDALVSELMKSPEILDISSSSYLPHSITSATFVSWEGKPEETNLSVFRNGIGNNFIDFYNLKIVSGRGYSGDFSADSVNGFIINETAAKMIGWDDPVGKKIVCNGTNGIVIGVVKDFNFQSLHLAIEPLAFSLVGSKDFPTTSFLSVKVNPGSLKNARIFVEETLKNLSPHYLNPVSVLSNDVDALYRSDDKLATIFIFSTLVAVLLTCLGQYSLTSYTTKSRTKEMVIRKIMGSQPSEIIILLFFEMSKWIVISMLFAWPLAYLLVNNWLKNFAFHIDPGIGLYFLSLLITLIISIISVSYHILKLSKINPAEMIRRSN